MAKAVVAREFGGIEHFELNESYPRIDPEEGFVRVRIKSSAFNPVDYKIRKGLFGGEIPKDGLVLGADFSGVVDAIGSNVTSVKVNDEVYGMALGPGSKSGSYAEYVTISEHLISRKPKSLSHVQSAGIVVTGLTAIACMNRVKPFLDNSQKQSALLIGASGGVGTMAGQLLKNCNLDIVATVGSEKSAEYVHKQLGIPKEKLVNYRGLSTQELAAKLTEVNGGPFQFALDLFGGEMKKVCLASIDFDGHVISIVEESDPQYQTPLYPIHGDGNLFGRGGSFHLVFVGARAFGPAKYWNAISKGLQVLAKEIESGTLSPSPVEVVGDLSSETVKKAHQLLEEHHVAGKLAMNV